MTARSETKADHWKRLGLLEGAPECAIEAAWLHLIAEHHPDRGGDTQTARAINVARDELRGAGAKANEYVAAHYEAQPWLVLGVDRRSDDALAQRVGRELASELRGTHRRLAERVDWAMANFSRPGAAPPASNGGRVRVTPPPPPRSRPAPSRRAAEPAAPGVPDGLPRRIDFDSVAWRDRVERSFKLTWKQFAPYDVKVDVPAPLVANVVSSKALPGRFAVTLSIDWDSEVFSHEPTRRGYTLDDDITLRWGGRGEAVVRVRGILLYPPNVTVAPRALDLGVRSVDQIVQTSLMVSATAPASLDVVTPAWLEHADGDGRPRTTPVRLEANVGLRLEFTVRWQPIVERAAASFAAERAVRPTGHITVRWDDRSVEVPVQMTVRPPKLR